MKTFCMRFHHVAFPVHDLQQARAFYEGVLSFRVIKRPKNLHGNGLWFANGSFDIHLIEVPGHRGPGFGDGKIPEAKHFAFLSPT